ncbi:MAG: hypothetical protein ACK5MZ_07425 [Aestuariibaculum sp.]
MKSIFIASLLLFLSCKNEKNNQIITISNPYLIEINEIDSIYKLNDKLSEDFILNSGSVFQDYSKLIWIKNNIGKLKNKIRPIESNYYSQNNNLLQRIKNTKLPHKK